MNKEEFLDKLKEIGTEEDEVARRTMLSDLTDEVTRVYDENSTFLLEKFAKHYQTLRKSLENLDFIKLLCYNRHCNKSVTIVTKMNKMK